MQYSRNLDRFRIRLRDWRRAGRRCLLPKIISASCPSKPMLTSEDGS